MRHLLTLDIDTKFPNVFPICKKILISSAWFIRRTVIRHRKIDLELLPPCQDPLMRMNTKHSVGG